MADLCKLTFHLSDIVVQARHEDLPTSVQYWLTKAPQLKRIETFFPRTRHSAPTASKAPVGRNVLQDLVSTAAQGREHVRIAKRLAAYLNALRPLCLHMCLHILQRYLHRGDRYPLARSMSPDPNVWTGGASDRAQTSVRRGACVFARNETGSRWRSRVTPWNRQTRGVHLRFPRDL
jgi:hypothetical protein